MNKRLISAELILAFILWGCGAAGPEKDLSPKPESQASGSLVHSGSMVSMIKEDKNLTEKQADKTDVKQQTQSALSKRCVTEGALPKGVDSSMNAQELHRIGVEKILKNSIQEAILILHAATLKEPDAADILGDFATALLQCDLYSEAIAELEKATKLAPQNVTLLANLAQVFQLSGKFLSAITAYNNAIKLAPDDSQLHNNLAVVLIATGNLKEAEKEIRKAIFLKPDEPAYQVNLGYALIRLERLNDAVIVLKRAVDHYPDNADAHNQLGVAYVALRQDSLAADEFKKALELNPKHRGAKENLSAVKEGFDIKGPWQNR
jgi:Flp pilus assembly protein TadD